MVRQVPPAALQGLDRIGETGRVGRAGDRGDFGTVLGHPSVEGGREVLGPNAIERRQAERRGPGLEEGVFGHYRLLTHSRLKTLTGLGQSNR